MLRRWPYFLWLLLILFCSLLRADFKLTKANVDEESIILDDDPGNTSWESRESNSIDESKSLSSKSSEAGKYSSSSRSKSREFRRTSLNSGSRSRGLYRKQKGSLGTGSRSKEFRDNYYKKRRTSSSSGSYNGWRYVPESGEEKHYRGRLRSTYRGNMGHFGHRRYRHGLRRRRDRRRPNCGRYGKFEESQCLWPSSIEKLTLPEACLPRNLTKHLPPVVAQYYEDRFKTVGTVMQTIFKHRGLDKPCGYCSKKVACRQLVEPSFHHSRHKQHKLYYQKYCRKVDVRFVNEECEGSHPCKASVINGACPAPFAQTKYYLLNEFIHRNRFSNLFNILKYHVNRRTDDSRDESEKNKEQSVDDTSVESPSSFENQKRYSLDIPLWHCVK